MQPKDVGVLLVLLAAFATAAWVMFLAADTRKRQSRMKAQAELNARLLDKFGSAQEIVQFLQTAGGSRFMEGFSTDREHPASGILRSTHRGIVLVVVSVGFLALAWHYRANDSPLLVIGVLLLCLGVGFLLSATVAHRLSKTLVQ